MCYNMTNNTIYKFDEEMIVDYEYHSTLQKGGKRKLVLFHLNGQHVPYAIRYPQTPENIYFTADSIKRTETWMTREKRQTIAEYDNATRYNDRMIQRIINNFANQNSVVVYLSDHGEEVYDYRDNIGRTPASKGMEELWEKYIIEIPFMVWCSDTYQQKHPEMVKRLKFAANRPFTIDNLCQMMFHLGSIQTEYYHAERDVLSDEYVYKPLEKSMTIRYDL